MISRERRARQIGFGENLLNFGIVNNQKETESKPRRGGWRWIRFAASILVSYLVIVLMFASFQRSLIYFPAREAKIEPDDAGLPRGQVHTITVRTEDGIELRGWHVLADGRTAENLEECDRELASGRRLVLYFSGNGANRRYRSSEFGILTRLGMDVFIFDYRGYGDNPGSPNESSLRADAHAIWNYATQTRRVSHERIILYGESLGGTIAVGLAADQSEAGSAPGGVILRSSFSSLVDAGAYHYPWLPVRSALVDRFPAADRIPKVTCPILQIHGTSDTIMPIALGRRLFAAAPDQSSSGIAKEFVELSGAGHNDLTLVAADELREAIQTYLYRLDVPQ